MSSGLIEEYEAQGMKVVDFIRKLALVVLTNGKDSAVI